MRKPRDVDLLCQEVGGLVGSASKSPAPERVAVPGPDDFAASDEIVKHSLDAVVVRGQQPRKLRCRPDAAARGAHGGCDGAASSR